MERIVTDVNYIRHKGKWWYLAGYLDLYNNELVEWELSDTFDNFLVMKPAKRLLEKQRVPNTKSFCTATKVFSTHPQVIATY